MINTLKKYLINIPGFHSNRRIVVIQSDDWGSIRMPSPEVYKFLLTKGIRVDGSPYNKYDSLESESDLSALFEVLSSFKDKNGNPPVLTSNTIVSNPNFQKIRESGFQQYFYEPFTETLKRYPKHTNTFELLKEGICKKLIKPQFHGREHINYIRWIKYLKNNIGFVRLAFDQGMYDLSDSTEKTEFSFTDAFGYKDKFELEMQKVAIIEGTNLFEKIFGYRSVTFIAPRYTWSCELNDTLKRCGIDIIQSNWYQFDPGKDGIKKNKKIFHYTGQKNKSGQYYIVRNAYFEPSQIKNIDWGKDILSRAEILFRLGKPLIISSHRLNYIGFIDSLNRDQNLSGLSQVLKTLLNRWPEIEFLSSDELGRLIVDN